MQKIWNLYKIINFRKFSGASNKIATAGLPRAAEPWRFLWICQIDINWKLQKYSPHQFILSEIFQVWVAWGGSLTPPPPPRSGNRVNTIRSCVSFLLGVEREYWSETVKEPLINRFKVLRNIYCFEYFGV